MNWFVKKHISHDAIITSETNIDRIRRNISRLQDLRDRIKILSDQVEMSHREVFASLEQMLSENVVQGRPNVLRILSLAVRDDGKRKTPLDSPKKTSALLKECVRLLDMDILSESRDLSSLENNEKRTSEQNTG